MVRPMGAWTDWILTGRQTLPRVGTVLRNLKPTLHLDDMRALDAAFIAAHDVRGIIWDIDGTLMPNHAGEVHAEFVDAFRTLVQHPALKHVIVSNSGETRFVELSNIFPKIPVLRAYRTDAGVRFRKLLDGKETWTGAASEVSSLRVIKKPDAALVEFAVRELGLESLDHAIMVGDQYFTDIAGANLAGVRSVKVETLHRHSFTFPVRLFQRTEAVLYRVLHGRPEHG